MKHLHIIASILASAVVLSGCTAVKNVLSNRDNGSLDYRDAQKLPPIQLPAHQPSAKFIPLYQTPSTVGELPNYTNESGKQYQLPRPPHAR